MFFVLEENIKNGKCDTLYGGKGASNRVLSVTILVWNSSGCDYETRLLYISMELVLIPKLGLTDWVKLL